MIADVAANVATTIRNCSFRRAERTWKPGRLTSQLELKLEELETAKAQRDLMSRPTSQDSQKAASQKPARQALPEHLPREVKTYVPKTNACPECGGHLRKLGEDVSEVLEYMPAQFRVIQHVRPKFSCASCEHIVQEPAPSRPIERGLAGPGLLARVLVAKYSDYVALSVMLWPGRGAA